MGVREGWRDAPAGGRKGHPTPYWYGYAGERGIVERGVIGVGKGLGQREAKGLPIDFRAMISEVKKIGGC